ncbi:MAG: META domain-containing protein [Saprospiraceae bacterium]|nr:META domain-containing protein [Saprospiraceae bacterium]MCB9323470.1 META domain-containing protein [Lewinellaceae bacterium]
MLIILSIAACGGNSNEKKNTVKNTPVAVTPLSEPSEAMGAMQMQKWEVTDMIYNNIGMGIALDKNPYLIFRGGRISGFAGCNSFVGEYVEGKDSGLNFKNIGSTKKMCPEAGKEEAVFIDLLNGANSYSLNSDHSKLKIISQLGEIHLIQK